MSVCFRSFRVALSFFLSLLCLQTIDALICCVQIAWVEFMELVGYDDTHNQHVDSSVDISVGIHWHST